MRRTLQFAAIAALLVPAGLFAADKADKPESNKDKPAQKENRNGKPRVFQKRIRIQVQPGQGRPVRIQRVGVGWYSAPNKLYLLRRPDVQKELKLDGDQQKQVQNVLQELNKQRRDEYAKLRKAGPGNAKNRAQQYRKIREKINAEADKHVEGILERKQIKRLNQIAVQMQGLRALQNPEVAKQLKLTDKQQKKIDELQAERTKKFRQLYQELRNGKLQRNKLAEKRAEISKDIDKQIQGVLTKKQTARFKKMKGKEFQLKRPAIRRAGPAAQRIRINVNGKKIKIRIQKNGVPPKRNPPKNGNDKDKEDAGDA